MSNAPFLKRFYSKDCNKCLRCCDCDFDILTDREKRQHEDYEPCDKCITEASYADYGDQLRLHEKDM